MLRPLPSGCGDERQGTGYKLSSRTGTLQNRAAQAFAEFHLDLLTPLFGMRFGETSAVTTVVYSLVGLAGLYQALTWKAIQCRWQGLTPARA